MTPKGTRTREAIASKALTDFEAKSIVTKRVPFGEGLPAANMLWRSGEFNSDEILRRMHLLKPVAAPGERFLYNNIMYLAAGKAAEHASGKSWSDLVKAELFEPLGMQSSLADSTLLRDFDNFAAPHATSSGQVKTIERYCPDVVAPAGAIHSTAADMARWISMHLDRGRVGDHQLLSADRVDEMQAPVELPSAEPLWAGLVR